MVGLIISLLMGEVLHWTSLLLYINSLVPSNLNAFLQSISTIFDDLHCACLAEAAVRKLWQGQGIIAS